MAEKKTCTLQFNYSRQMFGQIYECIYLAFLFRNGNLVKVENTLQVEGLLALASSSDGSDVSIPILAWA